MRHREEKAGFFWLPLLFLLFSSLSGVSTVHGQASFPENDTHVFNLEDAIGNGLQLYKDSLDPFEAGGDAFGGLELEIPFLQKSLVDLLGGVSFQTLFDIESFFTDLYNTPNMTIVLLQEIIDLNVTQDLVDPLIVKINDEANGLLASTPLIDCTDGEILDVSLVNGEIALKVCLEVTLETEYAFQADDLFTAFEGFLEVDLDATLAASMTAKFETEIIIDNKNSVVIEPTYITLVLDGDASSDMTVAFGVLELSSSGQIDAQGQFEFSTCNSNCDSSGIQLGATNLYFEKTVGYSIGGDLALDIMFPGLSLPQGANFTIADEDVFEPDPQVDFNFELTELDLKSFFDFSPQNAVNMLTKIDSALVRAQENEAFLFNIPFTDTSFSKILVTGSVLTSQLMKYFVKVEDFEKRATKSLYLTSTAPVDFTLLGQAIDITLFFFGEEGLLNEEELNVSVDSFTGVDELPGLVQCNVTLGAGTSYTSTSIAAAILNGLNVASCDVTACEISDCVRDEDDFKNCDCDVVVGVDDDDLFFIASVAYDMNEVARDVELIGLYDVSTAKHGATDLLNGTSTNLPLNAPATPGFVPRFRNFEDFTALINLVLEESFTGVQIEFTYVEATDPDPARLDLDIKFEKEANFSTGFSASEGIGDLVDISLDTAEVTIGGTLEFATQFSIIFEANTLDQLIIVGTACPDQENSTFTCDLSATEFELDIEDDSFPGGNASVALNLPAYTNSSASARLQTALNSALALLQVSGGGSYAVTVEEIGSNALAVKFPVSSSTATLRALKDCLSNSSSNAVVEDADVFLCYDTQTIQTKSNSYGLLDAIESKLPFQIAVGTTTIEAAFDIDGLVRASANVGGVIEVEADLNAELSGNLYLSVGDPSGDPIPFSTWLGHITAILANETNEAYLDGFFSANASFDGDFAATIQALDPFNFISPIGANGSLKDGPYVIDFLDINLTKPEVDFVVDLPTIGNVRDLSFAEIVAIIGDVLEFLIGAEADDSPTSCTGGLLGQDINGEKIFTYEIPVIGISACSFATNLQVLVDTVEQLTGGGEGTFNALEVKLETLLEDGVGGTPTVNVSTSDLDESDMGGIRVSTLEMSILLNWALDETREFNVDLNQVLAGDDEDPNLGLFLKAFVPSSGSGEVQVIGGLEVSLDFGLERRDNGTNRETIPFIEGTTGLKVLLEAAAATTFSASIGPYTGEVDLNVALAGNNSNDELILSVGLNDTYRYYLKNPTISNPTAQQNKVLNIGELKDEVDADFDGSVSATLDANIGLVNAAANIEVGVPSVTRLFKEGIKKNVTVFSSVDITPPTFPSLDFSFIDVLLANPQSLVDGLNNVFKTAEAASLGPNGIVTNFPAPFIRNSLGGTLGAGTNDNVLAIARRFVVPSLQEKLNGFEGETNTVADVLGRVIEEILRDPEVNLMPDDEIVTVTCYEYNNGTQAQEAVNCTEDNPTSIEWNIPFGQSFDFTVPVDFSLDPSFPVSLSLSGSQAPTLTIGWSFNLAFGYDEDEGFYLNTGASDDPPEFRIEALLCAENQQVEASLFFLQADLDELNITAGASVFVDLDKESALRKAEADGPNKGRLTQGEIKKITKISDLFVIGAVAGATLETHGKVELTGMGELNNYIPKLEFDVGAQLRTEVPLKESTVRRLLHEDNRRLIGDLHTGSDHPAYPLLRSLRRLDPATERLRLLEAGDVTSEEFFADDYVFEPCDIDGVNETECVKIYDVSLDLAQIKEFAESIVNNFVNDDNTGSLDQVVQPILPLVEPLPGLSGLAGRPITVVDIAEIKYGAKSGAPTIRKIHAMYVKLKELSETLNEAGDSILLAEECDVLKGFNCSGGLLDDGSRRRLNYGGSYIDPFGSHEDAKGRPRSPRVLLACPTSFSSCSGSPNDACDSGAGCSGKAQTAVCKAAFIKCTVGDVEGLTFPLLADPLLAFDILQGGDVILVDFSPPEVVFAFSLEIPYVLYPSPTVRLTLGFEFSVRIKWGTVLDTVGIRQAVETGDISMALNSFALKDTFDDVDEPLIVLTGAVSLEISVTAAIVTISAKGTVSFIATIDLFDPFPDTSGGLVRPYELFSLGTSPSDWFECTVSVFVEFEIAIKVEIDYLLDRITLYKITETFNEQILYFEYTPEPPADIIMLDVVTGELDIFGNSDSNELYCFSESGDAGNEEISCQEGNLYRTFSGVKTVGVSSSTRRRQLHGGASSYENGTGHSDSKEVSFTGVESQQDNDLLDRALFPSDKDLSLTGIASAMDFSGMNLNVLSLNYKDYENLLSNNAIIIQKEQVNIGVATAKFSTVNGRVVITTPKPEIPLLATTFKDCASSFEIDGHSNIYIRADLIQSGCQIDATGGSATQATLTVDFGSEVLNATCSLIAGEDSSNKVKITTDANGDETTCTIDRADGFSRTFAFSNVFNSIVLIGSICNDDFKVEKTIEIGGSVTILGLAGDDSITIGSDTSGVDEIFQPITVDGGGDYDVLNINDSGSPDDKPDGKLTSGSLLQILSGPDGGRSPITYENMEKITIELGSGNNGFIVTSTGAGTLTEISTGAGEDVVQVNETQGDLNIDLGDDNDVMKLFGVGDNAVVEITGGQGNDEIEIDGTGDADNSSPVNTFDESTVRWSGGLDNDIINVVFTSAGIWNIDIFDDLEGINQLNVDCTDFACNLLSRESFLANIVEYNETGTTSVERINIVRDDSLEPTAKIDSVIVNLNDGVNKVFFDDTFAPMDVIGGPDVDEFRFGQLYYSERDNLANVNVADPIETTLTTRGYLSDGNSHPISVKALFGNDFFDVLRNKFPLDLDGDSGDDTFVVRSFVNLVVLENGTTATPDLGEVKLAGKDGIDTFEISVDVDELEIDEEVEEESSPTDYVVNSLVDIDGGTGDDRLVVVGTEFDDSYVVTDDGIFGGGLTIQFRNINLLELTCEQGNDLVSVLSTGLSFVTRIYGGLGSDQFLVTPREVEAVTSKNLYGHRGILEHEIASGDEDYDKLLIEGVAVEVLDNDGDSFYINIVEIEPVHILTEDTESPENTFSFWVYPTRAPNGTVIVNVIPPVDISDDKNRYFMINGNDDVVPLEFQTTAPQEVIVEYNTGAERLSITDSVLSIKFAINEESTDTRFEETEQSLRFVDVLLLPGKSSAAAVSVTVVEPTGRTAVLEGDTSFGASYDIYLRPCTQSMAEDTILTINESVSGEVVLDKSSINGADWNVKGDCKVTINIEAIDDQIEEGDHFVSLTHIVTDAAGQDVLLSDNSTLDSSSILVRIYDNDVGSVIVQQTGTVTSTAEIDNDDAMGVDAFLYEDEYSLRLTKNPAPESVTVTIWSKNIATDLDLPSTATLNRDYTARIQTHVGNGTNQAANYTIVFDENNWNISQKITVTAFNDLIEEGVDLLSFPSQPSFLSFIQGPILLSGEGSADVPGVAEPLKLPNETDTETFVVPDGATVDDSSLYAIEEKQVDYLIIFNTDGRGDSPNIGDLSSVQVTGFNMGQNVVIGGLVRPSGLEYSGFEVISLEFGDGVEDIVVLNSSNAIHLIDTAGGDDIVTVQNLSGPLIVYGSEGSDEVVVSSESGTVDTIEAFLGFDGGSADSGNDLLTVDNTGHVNESDEVGITRSIVEFRIMQPTTDDGLPKDSYFLNLHGATDGTFELSFTDNQKVSSIEVDYDISAEDLESEIQDTLIPDPKSCGSGGNTTCSDAVKVYDIGGKYFIVFVGERLNQGVAIEFNASRLVGFEQEVYDGRTTDLVLRTSGIAYANLEDVHVKTGTMPAVMNVRGTSATQSTTVTTQEEGDFFFLSSEANENISTAATVEYLEGTLDYFENDLRLNAGLGKHRLLISDENSTIAKGSVGPALLNDGSLTNLLGSSLGDIFFQAVGGNWTAGVTLWLGTNNDMLNVQSVPSNPQGTNLRTTTTVNGGSGEDTITVDLDDSSHPGIVFVANGQEGNDTIDATGSTLGVIMFGGGGNDTLIGGKGKDIAFGDFGRVVWKAFEGRNIFRQASTVVAQAGGGGFGDITDGVVRPISEIFTVDPDSGGSDTISLGEDDDIGIGCARGDFIDGQEGNDILFGDSALVVFHLNSNSPDSLETTNCQSGGDDTLNGGSGDVDYLVGGAGSDIINGQEGMDLAFGDHALIKLSETVSHKLVRAETYNASCQGGVDTIRLGPGDDLAFGGAFGDFIYGDGGQDVILGDFGLYDSQVQFLPYQNFEPFIEFAQYAGPDYIDGGFGDDFIVGQEGNDTILGGDMADDIVGGHSKRFGEDGGDIIEGGSGPDAVLGDNGEIVRVRESIGGDFPWTNGMVWATYPSPFQSEPIRNIRRYDDIDYVQGDDIIMGNSGNDILHGQRGDDTISGGPDHDEIYGELGSDILRGDEGNDLLLGDVGHTVRRYDPTGNPIIIRENNGQTIWKKDVVLEEVGNITQVERISEQVNTASLLAENIASASLLFVANAFEDSQQRDPTPGLWITDLFLFQLNAVPSNDDISGGAGDDVLIGQRGDDTLRGGPGNDLLIGDAGINHITQTIDMPRIHEVFRALDAPDGSGYIVQDDNGFGSVFEAPFDLYPFQDRLVDYQSSPVDCLISMNDVQEESSLIDDVAGLSSIKTVHDYCMKPMFRVTPGHLYPTQRLHGNDTLESGREDSILVGDDIRGFTGLNVPQMLRIEPTSTHDESTLLRRDILNELVANLGVRLSTMEVDTEIFQRGSGETARFEDVPFFINIGQDNIKTDEEGQHFVTGDSLTVIARAVVGSSLGTNLTSRLETARQIFERVHIIEKVLVELHVALYDVHTDLLSRMRRLPHDRDLALSMPFHSLHISNDEISSNGEHDLVFGDSTVLWFQAHRPETEGFEFEPIEFTEEARSMLKDIKDQREQDLTDHVNNVLRPPTRLGINVLRNLPYDDVAYLLEVGSDTLRINNVSSLVVGDFGLVGTVSSSSRVEGSDVGAMNKYVDAIVSLRDRQFRYWKRRDPKIRGVDRTNMAFYNRRVGRVRMVTEPSLYGDSFLSDSGESVMLGDFLTGCSIGGLNELNTSNLLFMNGPNSICPQPGHYFDDHVGRRLDDKLEAHVHRREEKWTQNLRARQLDQEETQDEPAKDEPGYFEEDLEYFCGVLDGDRFTITGSEIPAIDGQLGYVGPDIVDDDPNAFKRVGDMFSVNGVEMQFPNQRTALKEVIDEKLAFFTKKLFSEHALITRMKRDLFDRPIYQNTVHGVKQTEQCYSLTATSFIPPFVHGGVDDMPPVLLNASDSTNETMFSNPKNDMNNPCGNGYCEVGEDCHSCPQDCRLSNEYCCTGGVCADIRCFERGYDCEIPSFQ